MSWKYSLKALVVEEDHKVPKVIPVTHPAPSLPIRASYRIEFK